MVATIDIAKNDFILFVPLDYIVNYDVVKQSEIFQLLKENGTADKLVKPEQKSYILYLMEQKRKPDSMWKHMLELWPKSYE